jgi:Domain of unknown function (DUF4131)
MKRPLIPVALLYVGGVLLAGTVVPLSVLFLLALATALLFPLWPRARKPSLGVLVILSGWINLAQRTAILAPDDLRVRVVHEEAPATVRGVLRETPRRHMHEVKDREFWTSLARVEVSAIQIEGTNWQSATGFVMTSTRDKLPDTFFAGQTVEVDGVLQSPRGPIAEGLFDYRNFLRQQGIYYQLEANNSKAWRMVTSPEQPPLADRFCAWAKRTLALGLPEEDESLRLEWALTLGWKAALTEEVSEPFMRAATFHIFAVLDLTLLFATM